MYEETNVDYMLCVNNNYIGVLGPQTKANIILSEGTHNVKLSVRALVGYNLENFPCRQHPQSLIPMINRNLIVDKNKNYIFDISKNPNNWSWGQTVYALSFYEVSHTNQKIEKFRPVINYVDPKVNLKETKITKKNIVKEKNSNKTSLKNAKKECLDLGFKSSTEKFGECVLELIK